MVILDFFVTSKANLNLTEVSRQFHEIYKGKKVSFHFYKTDSFQLLMAYTGRFEKDLFQGPNIRLLVGNINSICDENINQDELQIQYIRSLGQRDLKDWIMDVEGASAQIFISDGSLRVITDLLASIPIYSATDKQGNIYLSSYLNSVSGSSGNYEFDGASLVEFLALGTVTFPHTMYCNITQLCPASVTNFSINKFTVSTQNYWLPSNHNRFFSFEEAVDAVDAQLHRSISLYMKNEKNRALLMSGGEDSRLLASIMRKYGNLNSYILLDHDNREFNLASKVAKCLNFELTSIIRPKTFYFDILDQASLLSGDCSQYMHLHALTEPITSSHSLDSKNRIATGYLSDAVLKGSRVPKQKFFKKLGVDVKKRRYQANILAKNKLKIF